jgi:hypothetical protein
MGAAPPIMAKAALVRQRPAWTRRTAQRRPRSGRLRVGEQVGSPGPDQGGDGPGVLGGLGVEELDAAGQGAQAGRSDGGLGVPVGPLT